MFTIIKSFKYIIDSIYKIYRMTYGGLKFIRLLFQVVLYGWVLYLFYLGYSSWLFGWILDFIKNII